MSINNQETASDIEVRRQRRKNFLERIFPQHGQGYFCLAKSYERRIRRQEFFKYPDDLEKINDRVEQWLPDPEETYFCVHLLSESIRQQEYALPGRLLWADLDECPPRALGNYHEPRPQIIVATSPLRSQAYWILANTVDPITYRDLNYRIYLGYKGLGCDNCGNLTRILRMPETFSYKRKEPFYVHTIIDPRLEHKLINVVDMNRNLPSAPKHKIVDLAPDDMKYKRSLNQMTLVDKLIYYKEVPRGERTSHVFKLVVILKVHLGFGDGLAIQTLMKHPVWVDKWPDPKDRERNIRRCIQTLRERSVS